MIEAFDVAVIQTLKDAITIETPLRDIKAGLYKVDDLANLAEMLKDVISMANTSRRRGEPARIIFGVAENHELSGGVALGKVNVVGIDGQYIRDSLPREWEKAGYSKQSDIIDRELHALLRNYIQPEPDWVYLAGIWNERLIAYMEILPTIGAPYRLRRDIEYEDSQGKKKRLRTGDSWTRSGSGKVLVEVGQQHLLYCWHEIPYVAPSSWHAYADDCSSEFRVPLPDLFVQLICRNEAYSSDVLLTEVIDDFLEEPGGRVVYISGAPGAGKTTFLRDRMYWLSKQLAANLEAQPQDSQPRLPVPVWLTLSGRWFGDEKEFGLQLADSLDRYGRFRINRSPTPQSIFKDENLRFVLLLDGLDELESDPSAWKASLQAVRSFIERHRHVKAIVTSRPSGITQIRRGWKVVSVSHIPQENLARLLYDNLSDPLSVFEIFDSQPDILPIVSVPLTLEAMVDYARNSETSGRSITLAGLVGRIVDVLFWHESEKDLDRDRHLKTLQRIGSLEELAWWMDGKHNVVDLSTVVDALGKGSRETGYENLLRIEEMGVFRITPKGVMFSNEVLKIHFAARRLERLMTRERSTYGDLLPKDFQEHSDFWLRCWTMADLDIPEELRLLSSCGAAVIG